MLSRMDMRRTDRQVSDPATIDDILARAMVGHLGLVDDAGTYVVPFSFAVRRDGERVTVYIHGAGHGRKVDAIRARPDARICFQTEVYHSVADLDGRATGLSQWYESVIGFGTARVVDDPDEALDGLRAIVAKYFPEYADGVDPEALEHVTMLALDLDDMTGKANLPA